VTFTGVNDVLSVVPNSAGGIALVDGGGKVLACTTTAQTTGLARYFKGGGTAYVAVESASAITSLTLAQHDNPGVDGDIEATGITFPGIGVGDQWLGHDGGTGLYLATSVPEVWVASTSGGAAVEHDNASGDGIVAANMGFGGAVVNGDLFSVDAPTTANTSRVFRLWDGTSTPWMPQTWDLTPTYLASSPVYSITEDGTNLIYVTKHTTQAAIFSLSPLAAATPTLLGTSTLLNDCTGIAADDEFFYLACQDAAQVDGLFRLARTAITAAPLRLTVALPADIFDTSPSVSMVLDDLTNPDLLYFRTHHAGGGAIHGILHPDEATPLHIGEITDAAADGDYAFTLDRTTGWLYQFESAFADETLVRIK
jgi:hypothetical protein